MFAVLLVLVAPGLVVCMCGLFSPVVLRASLSRKNFFKARNSGAYG